ncbi:hypothetical protein GR140_19160 [Pseudomonas putida]|uniref:hypothetical protein n=1 Tax=Pseudomonas putida TaxID=303 RepID=UPI001BAEEA41|nr:hypothetical protein [Pseudomonas putida]QUG90786.1 hypothetical protein GR140_19160 [Pseudomonas putida]
MDNTNKEKENRNAKVIEAYMNNVKKQEISKTLGISRPTIDKILSGINIAAQIQNRNSTIIKAYINNLKKKEISNIFGISIPTVNKILRMNNVTAQDRKPKPKRTYKPRPRTSPSQLCPIKNASKLKRMEELNARAAEIVNLYKNGASVIEISKTYKLSRERIYQHLRGAKEVRSPA